ncbi:MAG TPA: Na+/H+ antiporter subunit C, partial [Arthrobacter bacterium]|nr:Na+/H+ antiporter subunit C [Arthrobacter sp.]
RQDEIQDDIEDLRVAETPRFDAEDDAPIPAETSEFPLTMLGSDGSTVSDHATAADGPEAAGDSITAGVRKIPAADAAAEEQPGSQNVTPGPEGGVK